MASGWGLPLNGASIGHFPYWEHFYSTTCKWLWTSYLLTLLFTFTICRNTYIPARTISLELAGVAVLPLNEMPGEDFSAISIKASSARVKRGGQCRERAAEINLHTVARDSAASEPIHAGIVIKLWFSVTGAPAVTKLQVMSRVSQRVPHVWRSIWARGNL